MIVSGSVMVIDKANIDTDQVIPAHYLTTIGTTGMGAHLFEGMIGGPQLLAAHPGASILVTGENFGCGSSREHAVWALTDRGFRVAIAPSFARIFHENAYNSGLVPIVLSPERVARCMKATTIEVDVHKEVLRTSEGDEFRFDLDPLRKRFILEGGFMEYMNGKIPQVRAWLAQRAQASSASV